VGKRINEGGDDSDDDGRSYYARFRRRPQPQYIGIPIEPTYYETNFVGVLAK
jgi:hypothetical protein